MKSTLRRRCATYVTVQPIVCAALMCLSRQVDAAQERVLLGHVPAVVATQGLKPLGRVPGTRRVRLVIGLSLRNHELMMDLLRELYDPTSKNFHHYLTPEQFTEQFGPTELDYERVVRFLKINGFPVVKTYHDREMVGAVAPVSIVDRAFHVTLYYYWYPKEHRQFFAPDVEPSIDVDLPIIFIDGLNSFSVPRRGKLVRPIATVTQRKIQRGSAGGSGQNGTYWAADFRTAYASGVPFTGTGQTVGLVEFSSYDSSGVETYEARAGINPPVPVNALPFDNFLNSSDNTPSFEATQDIEQVVGMAPGLSAVDVFEDPWNYETILSNMVAHTEISQFSNSWVIPAGPNPTADNYLVQMPMDGQSFFTASGDGDAYIDPIPWPADDPYVTSVGGTNLTMNGAGALYASEAVWNSGFMRPGWCCAGNWGNGGYWGSGGGISTSYAIPYWQFGVSTLANGASTTMRNVPDVAMIASTIFGYYEGQTAEAYGTSFAAPLWAGFTALVNQQAATWKIPPVGFLNPALYQIAQGPLYNYAFHDIATGSNEWQLSPSQFSAVNGYDLCTGWGSPQGLALLDALLPGGTVWVDFNYTGTTQSGTFSAPFKTLAQGVNASLPGGTIWIKTPGSSSERPTISKPVTIRVYAGPASIGTP